jgi:hypothetical protein
MKVAFMICTVIQRCLGRENFTPLARIAECCQALSLFYCSHMNMATVLSTSDIVQLSFWGKCAA